MDAVEGEGRVMSVLSPASSERNDLSNPLGSFDFAISSLAEVEAFDGHASLSSQDKRFSICENGNQHHAIIDVERGDGINPDRTNHALHLSQEQTPRSHLGHLAVSPVNADTCLTATRGPNTETAVRFTNLICDLSHMVGVTVVLPAANDDLPDPRRA